MDSRSFLEINMLDIQEDLVNELKKFTKESFNVDAILTTASELKYTKEIKRLLLAELSSPSDAFARHFGRQVYNGVMREHVVEQFAQITRSAFHQVINDRINERLKSALADDSVSQPPTEEESQVQVADETEQAEEESSSGIVTTEEEKEGFYIIKSLLREVIDVERVVMRDRRTYCSIILDNNQFKNICRLWFNSARKQMSMLDEDRNEEFMPVEDLNALFQYADKLKARIAFLDSKYEVGSIRPRNPGSS